VCAARKFTNETRQLALFVDKNKAVISGVFWPVKVKPGSDSATNALVVSLETREGNYLLGCKCRSLSHAGKLTELQNYPSWI